MVSQQRSVTDVDVYGKTAEKLISLIPPSCIIKNHADNGCATTIATEELDRGTQWTNRLANSSASDSPPPPPFPSSSSPSAFQRSRQWFSFRGKARPAAIEAGNATAQAKGPVEAKDPAEANCCTEATGPAVYRRGSSPLNTETVPITPDSTTSQRNSSQWESSSSPPINTRQFESSYLDYLQVAHASIEECITACRNWSSQYGAGELQTLSSISSPSSSAPSDPFSSSDAPDPDSGGDAGSRELHTPSETTSLVCDETSESFGPAVPVCKRHEDLLSFLIQLNRVQLQEGSEESEDIVSEFDLLLSDVKYRAFSEPDAVSENARWKNGLEPVQMNSGDFHDNGASDGRVAASEAVVQSRDVKNEVTSVGVDLPSKGNKLIGSALQSGGFTKRYEGLTGSPTIGPFLTALLNKLEAMKQNSLYVNLQLTGLIARLACYPQPLLSSLLLSHTLVFQPSIKSLMQVLNTIKCRTEEFLYKMKEKDQMLEHAYNFLLWRLTCHERTDSEDKSSSRRNSLMAFNSPKPAGSTKMSSVMSRLKLLDNKRVAYYANKQPKAEAVAKETQEMVEKKNAIYCAVVFKEFLKELAAISQEHAFLLTKEAAS